jgi:hypothetical protein
MATVKQLKLQRLRQATPISAVVRLTSFVPELTLPLGPGKTSLMQATLKGAAARLTQKVPMLELALKQLKVDLVMPGAEDIIAEFLDNLSVEHCFELAESAEEVRDDLGKTASELGWVYGPSSDSAACNTYTSRVASMLGWTECPSADLAAQMLVEKSSARHSTEDDVDCWDENNVSEAGLRIIPQGNCSRNDVFEVDVGFRLSRKGIARKMSFLKLNFLKEFERDPRCVFF